MGGQIFFRRTSAVSSSGILPSHLTRKPQGISPAGLKVAGAEAEARRTAWFKKWHRPYDKRLTG